MRHTVSSTDETFQRAFETCMVPARLFDHRAHLRLAYIYLCEGTPEQAQKRMKQSLLTFLEHLGLGASKYHETLTRAWVLAVRYFMIQTPACLSAEVFIEQNPVLLDRTIMLTHYSADILFSIKARNRFTTPDLEPIPEC